MEELKEKIADAIDEYKDRKIQEIDVDPDTDFDIFKEKQRTVGRIYDLLEDLDAEIDDLIEQMNEPSLYEQDMARDDQSRFRDLIFGG